nr:phenolic glucoside malonyltransferase 1-like [Malus domestica]
MFVKLWAHICKHENSNLLPDQLKPLYDRSVVQDTAGLEPIFLNQLLNMDSDRPFNRSLMFVDHFKSPAEDTIRGTFVFTREKIEALRQSVKEKRQQHGHQSVQYLSTFCVIRAYVWICLIKAKEIQSDHKAAVLMGFTVECRSRLDPSIPTTYFGNCLSCSGAVAETKAVLGEDGLIVAINAISEAIKRLDTDGVLGGLENLLPLMYSTSIDHESLLSIAGSPRFEIYGTDFGWGRPKKVEVISIEKTGAISLSESKYGGGGVEVGLVLKKHHMEAFSSLLAKGLANI